MKRSAFIQKLFIKSPRKRHVTIVALSEKKLGTWAKKQPKAIQKQIANSAFAAKTGQTLVLRGADGDIAMVVTGVHAPLRPYDFAFTAQSIQRAVDGKILNSLSFDIDPKGLKDDELAQACLDWGLASYQFDAYKTKQTAFPVLVWPKSVDTKSVLAKLESIYLLRDMINTPANDMGPADIEKAAKTVATEFKADLEVISDTKTLKKEFPLVFMVGDSSHRRPRLIDLRWGKKKDPAITIVGKGVCFDTGGLDLKPSKFMALMRKDMGGAAHALALARLIMAHKLPVRLRLLIPAVENAVSSEAFRPGDIVKSRKGITVENTHTDAEGRLILADALTYACEEKPELVIDFATLTGSARAALGQEIPAVFSNDEKLAHDLKSAAMDIHDPVWPMPLWKPYKRHIESQSADLHNSAGLSGDLIYSALFLESFLLHDTPWLHLDVFAWESTGRAGRARGGLDTGLRAAFTFIEKHYGSA